MKDKYLSMSKIELVELYLPDALVKWPNQQLNGQNLTGWHYLVNHSTIDKVSYDFDQNLGQYFFNNINQQIPHAALCAYFYDLDKEAHWIKADPVQYVLDMNKGFIVPGEFAPESNAKLALLINEFLSEDNLEFNIIDKQNGLIKCNKPIDYKAPSLINIINQPITFDQITGQDKQYFQKLSAEIQLLLHAHKTNDAEASGLYFGGTGELPLDKPIPQYNKIISNHYSALGLAKLANIDFEHLDLNKTINIEFKPEEKILISTQDFGLYWRSGNSAELMNLISYFDNILLELISLVKKNKLKKLVVNTGEKKYELTKMNIVKSNFSRFFRRFRE